mgnify:CR=1 FL=1
MIGGSLTITDSTNRSELFKIFNDDGHADHSANIGWIASVRGRGDFFLYGSGCPESVLISAAGYSPTFSVDNLGNARVLLTLGVTGVAAASPSSGISSLSVDNLLLKMLPKISTGLTKIEWRNKVFIQLLCNQK